MQHGPGDSFKHREQTDSGHDVRDVYEGTCALRDRAADLEEVLDEVDADEGGGAAHAGEVVGEHVAAQLKVVGDHGRHGRRRRKARARHNHDVNLRAPHNTPQISGFTAALQLILCAVGMLC